MLPVETVKEIQARACEAQSAKLLPELSGDGRKMFVQQGMEIKDFALEPKPRQHCVHSLVDLIVFARREDNKAPIVWHSEQGVCLLTDDGDRRDRVVFMLTKSDRFAVLEQLAEKKPCLDQRQLVRLLRVELGLDNVKVVQQFRKLDWQFSDETAGEVKHGQDRLGKTINAQVAGVSELPDELDIEVPVFKQTGERTEYKVRCAIEIDTVNKQFQLVPMPDELERVMDLAQADIHKRLSEGLAEKKIPVYYGAP
jgi:hypothetical protein